MAVNDHHNYLFLFSMFIFCFYSCRCEKVTASPKLVKKEVDALKEIAKGLGKKNWNFSYDPCSGEGNWILPNATKGFESFVTCDCSFATSTFCRVVSLVLKAQNLTGILPPQIARLRFLKHLDLTRNLLKGAVPSQWTTLPLLELSLMSNRLTGPFPLVLTTIKTLRNLSVEGNLFSGPLPPELGNLVNLRTLLVNSNNFSGDLLPVSIGALTNLIDLRLSGNNFSGPIPDFIGNLRHLEKIHIQGTSLEGPIPAVISALTNLTDLRISDLKGRSSWFPDLHKMESLKTLILRNCSIQGTIPDYIGHMTSLKTLDLSFNNLVGKIPDSFTELERVDFIYLIKNMLTGFIPDWILKRNKIIDISYNNFTLGNSGPFKCLEGNINAVECYSLSVNNINSVHSCLKKNFPCNAPQVQYKYSLHINCGGRETTINGTRYEADMESRGASMLYTTRNWAFSSTGNFVDNDMNADNYIAKTTSLSISDNELYTEARLSPMFLTYYGLCMINGNYTVKLHFAEIVFSGGNTFGTLGRRIFNVLIQGEMVLNDFNIEEEAGGPGKSIIKTFITEVEHNTLEIQFYWAGKGTTAIPSRGVYGPLVSAISVDPNFYPPSSAGKFAKHLKAITAISIMMSILIICIFCFVWRKGWLGGKNVIYRELRGIDLQTGSFTLRQIKAATKNFDPANKVGEGGFGSVYKGILSDETVIAVKQLSSKSKQGNREFVNEIGMISALQHPNLVKLYGCCTEGNQLILIYEYMENNCLARALFARDHTCRLNLNWPTRCKIYLGIARGLAYLHEESRLKIVHRDIKASNVLLDKYLNAKISDFGLAKLDEDEHSHISTRVAGTVGYMAPEYAMRGYLTDKADVYSFGVVGLEIVSGKSNMNDRPKEDFVHLLDWACVLDKRGNLLELVDPELGSGGYSKEEATVMLKVALLCTNAAPTLRPSMSTVVSMLEGLKPVASVISELSSVPGLSGGEHSRNRNVGMSEKTNEEDEHSSSLPPELLTSIKSHEASISSYNIFKIQREVESRK